MAIAAQDNVLQALLGQTQDYQTQTKQMSQQQSQSFGQDMSWLMNLIAPDTTGTKLNELDAQDNANKKRVAVSKEAPVGSASDSSAAMLMDPASEAFKKMLTIASMKSGFEAVQSGMHPEDLAPMLDRTAKAINNIGASSLAASVSNGPPTTATSVDQVNQNIQQQAVDMTKPQGMFGKFIQGGANDLGVNQAKIANMAALQKLVAGQPAEIALPQAQAENQKVSTAAKQQEINGEVPWQKGEMQKALATAGFDTTKLTNEAITASATAFDKVYSTLSGPEKLGMMAGVIPERIKALTEQLKNAPAQQSRTFEKRGKLAGEIKNKLEKTNSTKSGFKVISERKE